MMHIVDRQQMCADSFFRSEVVDVRAGHAESARGFGPACGAGAFVFDRAEV